MFVHKGLTLPCFAVIFASVRNRENASYDAMADEINALVRDEEGFMAMESVHDSEGQSITVCYWRSIEDIKRWKEQTLHREAQERGRLEWYAEYAVRIVEIKESYDFS